MKPLVEVLLATTEFFKGRGIPSARLDAELLIGDALGLDRVGVYLAFDRPLVEAELGEIRARVRRRGAREPLAWIVGHREFYGREFAVGPGVLVPRPDTETLVEAMLAPCREADPIYVADVGSGSGCIGLTLAAEVPGLRLYATDVGEAPLAYTRKNTERLGLLDRVAVLRGPLLDAVPASRPLDWVVSNPPYVPRSDLAACQPEVRDHEPRLALDGGRDGLDVYRALIPVAAARARVGVAVEVGIHQAQAVAALMQAAGLHSVETRRDLAGVERVVIGRRR
ncbi:MAG: peptide chain release factor N(5)-glutamine methyltransferase [Myxococcales bacterium]|nr:peptide chain release factor N(5)-glutamine methyltransferase [Myxococcales bacterium]